MLGPTAELYRRLRIIGPGAPAPAACASPRIAFDVYRPNRKYSKRAPPPVSFKVVVQGLLDAPPDAHASARLFAEAAGVPLKVAIVQAGAVIFYSWVNLRLPDVAVPLVPTGGGAGGAAPAGGTSGSPPR